jgi:hypothetical protein
MSTIYYDIECNFTQIPNHIILNKNISTKKFFQCYLKYEENIDITSQLESKPLIEFLK